MRLKKKKTLPASGFDLSAGSLGKEEGGIVVDFGHGNTGATAAAQISAARPAAASSETNPRPA